MVEGRVCIFLLELLVFIYKVFSVSLISLVNASTGAQPKIYYFNIHLMDGIIWWIFRPTICIHLYCRTPARASTAPIFDKQLNIRQFVIRSEFTFSSAFPRLVDPVCRTLPVGNFLIASPKLLSVDVNNVFRDERPSRRSLVLKRLSCKYYFFNYFYYR